MEELRNTHSFGEPHIQHVSPITFSRATITNTFMEGIEGMERNTRIIYEIPLLEKFLKNPSNLPNLPYICMLS